MAGLTLATLALPRPGDPRPFLMAFSGAHPYLREYFIESVLSRQPSTVQAFLLKTAILKHLTGPLCDAMTGRTDGTEMLLRLWQENLTVSVRAAPTSARSPAGRGYPASSVNS